MFFSLCAPVCLQLLSGETSRHPHLLTSRLMVLLHPVFHLVPCVQPFECAQLFSDRRGDGEVGAPVLWS